ncbi:hypothetical protein JW859_10015, partial [bacterium]|nr:hypothetical protein [bacterium]
GQGKPMPKDASGAGTNWGTGIQSDDPAGVLNPLNSRLDFDGTVQPTDLDRATDAREKGRIGIFGSALSYAGSSPRITSEPIGRDINPLGRGSGMALVGGELNLGRITPTLPLSEAHGGNGSSVNNDCGGGCGDLGGDGGGGDKGDLDSGSRMCCYDAKTGNCWDPEYWDGPCVEIPCDSEKCKDSGVKGGGGQGSGGGQFPQYAPTTQICGRWDWTSWNGTNSPRYNTYCPIVNWLSCPWYRCTVSEHYTGWKCVYYKKGSSNTQKRFAWQTIICSGSITWWGIDPRNPLRGFGWHTLWHVCQQRSRVVTMCKVCDKP